MKPEISIEFFPPQTAEGMEKLRTTVTRLAVLKPEFFSVTYGAGGSTRDRTLATVMEIAAQGHSAAPHLSCVGSTRDGVREMLATFAERGIRRIVALIGVILGQTRQHIVELVCIHASLPVSLVGSCATAGGSAFQSNSSAPPAAPPPPGVRSRSSSGSASWRSMRWMRRRRSAAVCLASASSLASAS